MADQGRVEQIVSEFVSKAAFVVLQSRVPGFGRSEGSDKPAGAAGRVNSWFNLETAEPESTRVEVEPWRRDTSLPMLLEVSMLHRKAAAEAVEAGEEAYSAAVVLERWSILFVRGDLGERPQAGQRPSSSPSSSPERMEVPTIYKHAVILLRTLYAKTRLLPAARAARVAARDGAPFEMRYALRTSTSDDVVTSPTPCSHHLAPVRTPFGSLYVSVAYTDTMPLLSSMMTPATIPRIISDYVYDAGGYGNGVRTGAGGGRQQQGVAGSAPPGDMMRRASWSHSGRSAATAVARSPSSAAGMPLAATRTSRAASHAGVTAPAAPFPTPTGEQTRSSPMSIPLTASRRRSSSGGDLEKRHAAEGAQGAPHSEAASRVVGFSPGGGAFARPGGAPYPSSAPAHAQHGMLARERHSSGGRAAVSPAGSASPAAGSASSGSQASGGPIGGLSMSPNLPFAGTPSSSQLSIYGSLTSRGFVRRQSFSPSPPSYTPAGAASFGGRDPSSFSPKYAYGGVPLPSQQLPMGSFSGTSGGSSAALVAGSGGSFTRQDQRRLTYGSAGTSTSPPQHRGGGGASPPLPDGTPSPSSSGYPRSSSLDDSGAVFTADLSAGGSGFPFAVDDDVGGSLLGGIGGGSQRGAARAAGGGAWAGDEDAEVEPVEVAVGALVTLLSEAPALGGQAPSSELRGCAIDVSRAASAAGGGAGNGMTFVNVLGRLQVLCDEA
jgi:autophagy-related protein 13